MLARGINPYVCERMFCEALAIDLKAESRTGRQITKPIAHIDGAIVDKNCRIGRRVHIVNSEKWNDFDVGEQAYIRDGIVCIPKDAVLPDRWRV